MSVKITHLDRHLNLPDADVFFFFSHAAGELQAYEALAHSTSKFGILKRSEGSY